MRLVTFEAVRSERFGALVDDRRVLDLSVALAWHEAERGRASDPLSVARAYGEDMLGFVRRQD